MIINILFDNHLKMRKSKSPKTKGKIEDQLNNENLKMLQQIFEVHVLKIIFKVMINSVNFL